VILLKSRFIVNVVNSLYLQGFIRGYHLRYNNKIVVYLKYNSNNSSIIRDLQLITRPSQEIYCSYLDLLYLTVYNNGIFLISTSKGLISSSEALQLKVGGKVLLYIT